MFGKTWLEDTGVEIIATGVLLMVYQLLEMPHEFADVERLSLDLVVLVRHETVDAYAQQGRELSEVLLGHYNLLVF